MDNFFEDIDDSMADTSSVKKPKTRKVDDPDKRQLFHDNQKDEEGKPYECSELCSLYGCQYEVLIERNISLEAKVRLLEVKMSSNGLDCTNQSLINDRINELTNKLNEEKDGNENKGSTAG